MKKEEMDKLLNKMIDRPEFAEGAFAAMQKAMERYRDTIAALDALTGGDPERAHVEAERILLNYVRAVGTIGGAAEVVAAYERVRDRVGFWYA